LRALTELKKECFKHIGSNLSCFCCGESKLIRLLVHHLSYTSKSVTYNKWGNSDHERLKYYSNLLDEIKEDNDNFLVLCFNCHKRLEELLKMSYEDVLLLARQKKITEMMILSYDLTQVKRNLKALEMPELFFKTQPIFMIDFDCKWNHVLSGGLDFIFSRDQLYADIRLVLNEIETKSMSLNDFSESVIIHEPPENYIMSYGYVTALRMLESFRTIKSGDTLSFVRINNNKCVPIELAKKSEIDSKYYHRWFISHIINISKGLITYNDIKNISNKPLMTGLDEFFWR
jgi:hypothetical protein